MGIPQNFGGVLNDWPLMRIDSRQNLPFQADPQASVVHMLCVAFVWPQLKER